MKLLRQDGNQGNGIVGRQKLHGFLVLFAFQKAGGHQLLQNPGAGGGGAQPFALGVLRHIVLPGSFHRGEQGVLGEMLGRGSLALLDGGTGDRQLLAFGQFRQRLIFGIAVLFRRTFHAGPVGGIQRPPAGLLHRAAFGGELRAIALHHDRSFIVDIGRGHRTQ